MKYANFAYNGRECNSIGDQMQILAIDYLYARMGIKDIVYIDKNDLQNYNGEEVILPIAFPLFEYFEGGIHRCFSDKITPIFLGHTIAVDKLTEEEIVFYKRYEPIGCRDERMFQLLHNYGISCYLSGCMTTIFPRRKGKGYKVFIVDVPEGIKQFIPHNILSNAEITTHYIWDNQINIKQFAIQRYQQYRDEASLVITSLLHCAVPCLAAGIPTIIVRSEYSYRFAWLERISTTYLPEEFDKIDYKLQAVDYEREKELFTKVAADRLRGKDNKEEIERIHQYYMNRIKREYKLDSFEKIKSFLENEWENKEKSYQYSIWGVTQIACLTVNYIKENYPNATLLHVYDKYRKLKFEQQDTLPPENILNNQGEYIFVTAQAAKKAAEEHFKKINKAKEKYVIAEVTY